MKVDDRGPCGGSTARECQWPSRGPADAGQKAARQRRVGELSGESGSDAEITSTLPELASYLDTFPGGLRVWRAGADSLYPMLGWINTKSVVDLRDAFSAMGPAAVRIGPVLHNQAGTAVSWALTYLGGPVGSDPGERSRRVLWELARRHWVLRNLLSEARHGDRGFEAAGNRIRLPFRGDVHLDALDRLLGTLTEIRGLDIEGRPKLQEAAPWLDAGGRNVGWSGAPAAIRAIFRASARALIASYPRYLPDMLDVGGFTMGEAARVLDELLARAQYSQACIMRGSTSPAATIPFYLPEELTRDLAHDTGVSELRVERLLGALWIDLERCPDPCLTPIVPVGRAVVPMSSLIAPGSPLRNLTARLQLDPTRFGAAGQALGRLGVETCAETLRRVAGVLLATNVRLVTGTGKRVGDLDVVLVDLAAKLMVVFEVTWQIGVDGAVEIARALDKAADKRTQVARNRDHLGERTAAPRWPAHWPDFEGYASRWYVITRDVLPVGPPLDDVIIRSHQMLAWMLKSGATLEELVRLLDHPPAPPEEVAMLHSTSLKFGRYTVEWDQVVA